MPGKSTPLPAPHTVIKKACVAKYKCLAFSFNLVIKLSVPKLGVSDSDIRISYMYCFAFYLLF